MGWSAYIPAGDFGRVCDVCGRLRPGKGFRIVENRWICDRHPSYVPREQLDRVPFVELGAPKQIPGAKPLNLIDTYEIPEAQVLNLVAYAPASTLDVSVSGAGATGADTVQAAAWAALYLYDLIVDAHRPARWATYARGLLATLADWLVTHQKGGPGVSGYTSSDLQWGAYNRSTSGGEDYLTQDSSAAGLALLRAYQVFGSQKYLDAARACAWFLRGAQCGDKLASRPSSTDAAGASPHHFGFWTSHILLNAGSYDFDHRYGAGDLIGLEFLAAWRAALGDEVIGSATTNAVFNASRAAAVSVAIAEARAFWRDGAFSVDDGAVVVGLSSSTPREFYDAYPASKGVFTGRGSWAFRDGYLATGTLITSLGWALALRALRAVGDATATTLFDWLMTFSSNTAFEPPAMTRTFSGGNVTWTTANDRAVYAGVAGAYNPKTALATVLLVRSAGAAVATNGSSLYDLATAGLLAPLYSSRQQTAFASLKDSLGTPRPRWREGFDPRDGQYLWLPALGISGLAFQPYTDAALGRQQSVQRAAMLAGVFRQAPQSYTGRGHS